MFVDPVPDPWCAFLESHWREFLAEMQALPASQWIEWAPPVHNYAQGASIVPLVMKYVPPWLHTDFGAHRRQCPAIARVATELPGVYTVCLSRMAPGARVAAHRDHEEPGFLRIHLGLEVDPEARFRCEREWRSWEAGRCFAFLAQHEHEVVHAGTRPRVALLVDVDAQSLQRHGRVRAAR